MERNLREDLEICYAATKGHWSWCGDKFGDLVVYSPKLRGFHNNGGEIAELDYGSQEDARFIAEARDGWPHAIERALDAEMKIAQMERRLRAVESTVGRMLDSYGYQDFWGFVTEYETEEVSLDDKA
ncbi:hypothetical protein [Brevibacillus laterosporus]|uniref:hypothetical protein n=1 Tax=Brevibacillus laterosporus TaxID=1465 RepID=UPI000EAFA695|nr:hypothetical protein [Brevibacillus laterosporus]AYK07724.1 hypothetical protein D8Z77_15850 [Brevibacillus laterosporus]